MKVAKYWARESATAEDPTGYKYHLISWSGSNQNLAEAKQKAIEKLSRWKTSLREGQLLGAYPYEDKDEIKEELIQELYDDDGNLIAAITRNRYGALVLNSAEVLFADVDLPTPVNTAPNPFGKLLSLFGKGKKAPDDNQNPREEYRQRFTAFQDQNPELTLRIYETAAGFRAVILNKLFAPLGDDAQTILKELNSDALYIRLCRSQECFRARLTPKPWRCDVKGPPSPYPREEESKKERYLAWLQNYERKSQAYAVCNVVEELGDAKMAKSVQAVLALHDQYVLNANSNALA